MKKLVAFTLLLSVFVVAQSRAQDYELAGGLGFDFGGGYTLIGPSAKYFFTEEHAAQAEILFETNLTVINGFYEYNSTIAEVDGLNWFAGGGISLWLFGNGFGSELALRPKAGVEYVIEDVPLVVSFDWRPIIGIGDLNNKAGAFGLSVKYIIQ